MVRKSFQNKRAAIELSMSTIVVLVLAMSMLILGLVLIKSIFTGATYNVQSMNDRVKDAIGKLFSEERKVVLYIPSNNKVVIKQGEDWGVQFGIKNFEQTRIFKWEVDLQDSAADLKTNCGLGSKAETTVMGWFKGGKIGETEISAGDEYYDQAGIRISVPKGAVGDVANCIIRFHFIVKRKDLGTTYDTQSFDLQVT